MSLNILIPCKSLVAGKSRLAKCLDPLARRDLCAQMLHQTLGLAVKFATSASVWLVSSDPEALRIGMSHRVHGFVENGCGLNSSLDEARVFLLDHSHEPEIMIIPIDLPFASITALDEMVRSESEVVIAPNKRYLGTNVLLLRSAAVASFQFLYGRDSYEAHIKFARRCGLAVTTVRNNELSFDVDEPEDLMTWRSKEFADSEFFANPASLHLKSDKTLGCLADDCQRLRTRCPRERDFEPHPVKGVD